MAIPHEGTGIYPRHTSRNIKALLVYDTLNNLKSVRPIHFHNIRFYVNDPNKQTTSRQQW
jgi:hypothetical protein